MNTFFPHKSIEQKPLPPSKAERISSWIGSAALVPVVSLQVIGAVPLHAIRDAGLGPIGRAADRICDLFHGIVSEAVPQAESWAEAFPVAVAHGVYFGALTLFAAAFAASVSLGMLREQKNFARRMGDRRCW